MIHTDSQVLAAISGFTFVLSNAIVFWRLSKFSGFSWVVLYAEYFTLIGVGFGVWSVGFDIGVNHDFFDLYIYKNGLVSYMTFLHVICYALGCVFGVFFAGSYGVSRSKLSQAEDPFGADRIFFIYRSLLIVGISLLVIYAILVGPVTALVTASTARSGVTDGLEDVLGFLFLKNLAQVGTFAVVFVPFLFVRRSHGFDIFLLVFYGFLLYLLTGARAALVDTVLLAGLVYLAVNKPTRPQLLFIYVFALPLGILFVVYGKGMGGDIFSYLFDVDFVASPERRDPFAAFVSQFIHLVYSIDFGIKYFFENGPFVSKAILLAPFGVMPSWMYSILNIEFLSWQALPALDNLVCVNTNAFPSAGNCTIPPYFVGVSGYLGPVFMGFLFGFFKFFVYGRIGVYFKSYLSSPLRLWVPMLVFFIFSRASQVIPNVIGLFSFYFFFFLSLYLTVKFVRFILIRGKTC